jgi:hypothetical protein
MRCGRDRALKSNCDEGRLTANTQMVLKLIQSRFAFVKNLNLGAAGGVRYVLARPGAACVQAVSGRAHEQLKCQMRDSQHAQLTRDIAN